MTPRWTPRVLQEIAEAVEWIAQEEPAAAAQLHTRVLSLVDDTLVHQPMIGRPGRVADTRELVAHSSYILVYRVRGEDLEILSFRHAARLWPEAF